MSIEALRKTVKELAKVAVLEKRQSPFLAQSDWPPGLKQEENDFAAKMAAVGGNRYEWLIENLHLAPITALKEPYNSMQASENLAAQREVYEAVRQGVRIRHA